MTSLPAGDSRVPAVAPPGAPPPKNLTRVWFNTSILTPLEYNNNNIIIKFSPKRPQYKRTGAVGSVGRAGEGRPRPRNNAPLLRNCLFETPDDVLSPGNSDHVRSPLTPTVLPAVPVAHRRPYLRAARVLNKSSLACVHLVLLQKLYFSFHSNILLRKHTHIYIGMLCTRYSV